MEIHRFAGTLDAWLRQACPGYSAEIAPPFVAYRDGVLLPVEQWADEALVGSMIMLKLVPRNVDFWIAVGQAVLATAVSAVLSAALTKKPKGATELPSAKEMSLADVQANVARLGEVVPDIAGQVWRYPDYLCPPRRYFVSESVQGVDLMLNVGVGEFEFHEKRIGKTAFAEFGAAIEEEIFAPGADVSGNPAHECWYSAPEVGATTGGSGIRLVAGSAARTDNAVLQSYIVTGSSIIAPTGAGVLPQDWEAEMIVGISIPNKSITVVDGGGTWPTANRDLVRGDFSDQGLAAGDLIRIASAGDNDGIYQINSISTTSTPGSASSVTGVKVAPLEFAAEPITFTVAGQTVLLDDDYLDADELVAAIDAQIGGLTVSQADGVIKITDDSPFDGSMVALAGYYEPVFGAAPTHVVGAITASYDELTLNSWSSVPSGSGDGWDGSYVPAWVGATALWPGSYPGAVLEKVRPVTQDQMVFDPNIGLYAPTTAYVDNLPRYRITSTVTGTLPDGSTGIVGYEFQRLTTTGADDPGWSGFAPEGVFQGVTMRLESINVVGGWVGPFDISPEDELVDAIEHDVFAPQGIAGFSKTGSVFAFGVGYEFQYRVNGGEWVSSTHSRVYGTQNQLGWTERIVLPRPGRNIQARMRRTAAERNYTRIIDHLEWYGVRSRIATATSYPGWTTVALRITGGDLVSAQVQREVNYLVTRKLNGVATRGITDYALYVMESIGYPTSAIDVDEFEHLGELWAERGDYFDFEHVQQLNALDVLRRILAAGFAEPRASDGLLSVVRPGVREAPEHMHSLQSMLAVPEVRFSTAREEDPDGVDVTYRDPVTNTDDVVQCRLPGQMGYRAERMTAEGVRDRTRAWRMGMRRLRQLKYRRWQWRFPTEMSAFNSDYMSCDAVVEDIPGYGQSGLILRYSVDGANLRIETTEFFEVPAGESRVVAWRLPTGRLAGPFAAQAGAFAGEVVALSVPVMSFPVIDPNLEPPHVFFGTSTHWCTPVLIQMIDPQGLDSAMVEAVNYDAREYADDDSDPPD